MCSSPFICVFALMFCFFHLSTFLFYLIDFTLLLLCPYHNLQFNEIYMNIQTTFQHFLYFYLFSLESASNVNQLLSFLLLLLHVSFIFFCFALLCLPKQFAEDRLSTSIIITIHEALVECSRDIADATSSSRHECSSFCCFFF